MFAGTMSQVFVIADARGDIQTCKECEPSPLRRQKAELAGLVAATSVATYRKKGATIRTLIMGYNTTALG